METNLAERAAETQIRTDEDTDVGLRRTVSSVRTKRPQRVSAIAVLRFNALESRHTR